MSNILFAITGLSPQVITETLFALHQQRITVDEIHVITTRIGREYIHAHLLAQGCGQYHRYLQEYGIEPTDILFTHDQIHTLVDENGSELDDISNEDENEILLKKCLELAYQFTKNPDTSVFFSIAGGRKTMSACLMVAAQMYGRPQDRIYHVLVSPEFESNRDFYYPPKKSIALELRDARGQKMIKETSYAKLTLVPIPFIPVRHSIEDKRTGRIKTPAQLLRFLIKEKTHPLIVDLQQSKIIYKKTALEMMPSRLALYAFFVQQKMQCEAVGSSCRNCSDCYLDFQGISKHQQMINDIYQGLAGMDTGDGICRLEKESFRAYISKIRQDIQHTFGLPAAAQLTVEAVGKKPNTRYGIKIDRKKMRLIM
jgi:CRISPR-associated protein (TIGR02584 family)